MYAKVHPSGCKEKALQGRKPTMFAASFRNRVSLQAIEQESIVEERFTSILLLNDHAASDTFTFLKLTKEAIEDGKKMKDTIHDKERDMVLQVTVTAFNPTLLRHQW